MESSNENVSKWKVKDKIFLVLSIVVGFLIFFFSSLPNPLPATMVEPCLVISLSNTLHFLEFAALSFCLVLGLEKKIKGEIILIIAVAWAIIDEVHQIFVPNRYFDVLDLIIDAIGILTGFSVYFILKKLIVKIKQ
ncbi:MAG: VanZ family protein [Candidatus Lokiarchaeota archaeon]|nr:VanZ family protein [Candidatus Lokiarchaeota archaeon]